jgi:hypothetical protein
VAKRDVIKHLGKETFGETELVCIFEEYYGHKYRNYEALILGNTRISLLEKRDDSRQISLESTRSKKRIKYHYEVYIEHFKLKNFINKVIPIQGHFFFHFTLQHLQQNSLALWTFDTLLEWRDHLISKGK